MPDLSVSYLLELMRENLFIHEVIHGVIAIPFAYLLYRKTGSFIRAAGVIAVTYAVDFDHLVDYFLYFGFHFNLLEFLDGIYFDLSNHSYILLHAWDWLLILALLAWRLGWKSIFTVILFGLLTHLIIDSIAVASVLYYSVVYRAINGFVNL